MRFQLLGLLLCLLTLNGSCVGHAPAQDAAPKEQWSYDSMQFEISPITTAALPNQAALDWFRDQLHEFRFCDKAHITFVIQPVDTETPPSSWSSASLAVYTARRRTLQDTDVEDRNYIVFVPYIDGPFTDGAVKILGGLQYQPSAFAVFKRGAGTREPAVLLHEFGHLIGLVDERTHHNVDREHTQHCADTNCVMYWSVPTDASVFDAHCLAYIREKLASRIAKLY